MAEQLLLWEDTKEEILERQIQKLKESQDKTRRGWFAENASLKKQVKELEHRFNTLEMALCRCNVETMGIK